MKQKLISGAVIILSSFVFLFFPPRVFATLYINEFSSDTAGTTANPDWVEIYNSGTSIDLAGYQLEDLNGINKKTLSGTISASSFATFDWTNRLNKTGDVVSLVKISDLSLVDRVSYGDQGNDVSAPSENQAAGRSIDGGNNWIVFDAQTKNSTNNSAAPAPTATPTSTPTPTNAPTPTKIPTPTPTSKPTATPKPAATATSVSTSTPTKSISPTPTKPMVQENTKPKDNMPTSILGEMTAVSPSVSPTIIEPKEASFFNFSNLTMGVGVVFVALSGILAFRRFRKEGFPISDEE